MNPLTQYPHLHGTARVPRASPMRQEDTLTHPNKCECERAFCSGHNHFRVKLVYTEHSVFAQAGLHLTFSFCTRLVYTEPNCFCVKLVYSKQHNLVYKRFTLFGFIHCTVSATQEN